MFLLPLCRSFGFCMFFHETFLSLYFVRVPWNCTWDGSISSQKQDERVCVRLCVCMCSGKFPYWGDSVVFFGKSMWFELEWSLSVMLLVCWTVSGWPGKIRRHMATLTALVCLYVCVCTLQFKEKPWVSWEPGKSEPGSGRRFQADNRQGVIEC